MIENFNNNNIKLVAYYVKRIPILFKYIVLKPTKRWKLCNDEHQINHMFVEHKRWFSTEWIPEEDIIFLPERNERIFNCND